VNEESREEMSMGRFFIWENASYRRQTTLTTANLECLTGFRTPQCTKSVTSVAKSFQEISSNVSIDFHHLLPGSVHDCIAVYLSGLSTLSE
jgi:hypothetical protein